MNKRYYILSNEDSPVRVCFEAKTAFELGYRFVDCFNEDGFWEESYELIDSVYTNENDVR